MEQETQTNEEPGKFKAWMQDNLRIIISILIVVAIAGGIYSYSKRTEAPSSEQANSEITNEEGITAEGEKSVAQENAEKKGTKQAPVAVSQETEKSFVETAVKGDGTTHLARRALANYLEKNPDTALTPEHKIYIEDYLRKNVPQKRVFAGTSVEFSKELIQSAITKSKNLNEKQLKNLKKFSSRVPSLS